MKLLKLIKPNKKQEPLNLYESLSELWLYNWHKMQEQNDPNWLRIDFDGRQKKINDIRLFQLKKKLEDDYFIVWNDDVFAETLKKRNEMNYYIGLYQNVNAIIHRMRQGFNDDQLESRLIFIRQLKQLKYVMPELNSVVGDLESLNKLEQQNEGVKVKIKMLADDIKVEQTKITRTLNVELAEISKTLELGYSINSKEITVVDWIDFQKEAKEVIKRRKLKEN